ncbi:aspartate kinase [Dinghuibacter silviterrae]|uniref:Aspartokinase n=1 Tax=Dinghuibacter silviterrae TaxID=1539049 RepID=A0A4V3GLW4_9BACT|nr:aspartate kinase [Dinghuibacter silviterrae]TDX01113.1 aspartate kinase [Dinghuibacter silviterrae]
MQVFKFGGASVNSTERIQRVASILEGHKGQPLVVVISAMGKTTNELEKVAEAFYRGHAAEALDLFEAIKRKHLDIYNALIGDGRGQEYLVDLFTEVEWLLHDRPVREYDYYYDQIVCIGELLSTTIMHRYLDHAGIPALWVDVRDILRTDAGFRDATVDLEYAAAETKRLLTPLLEKGRTIILQGFIGATAENESTTLGREGSDYTAAIFSNLLGATSLTIWKDVEGVMNADPKLFSEAQVIPELNYTEVIEMAYYGAQVIHPKTIKPLQNKHIPMHVRCFLDPSLPGTLIHDQPVHSLPPVIVLKQHQVLLHLKSRDFSFAGAHAGALYTLLKDLHVQPNLIQNGAITIQLCVDDRGERTERLAQAASAFFDVSVERGLTLLTIRHYNTGLLETLTEGATRLLRQQTAETVQVLLRKA